MSETEEVKQTVIEGYPSDTVWKFGYGSNMSESFLKNKKHVDILVGWPAICKDFTLAFPTKGMAFVEPSFATIYHKEGDEVHGFVCGFNPENAKNLDAQEGGGRFYHKQVLTVTTYDGKIIQAEAYTAMAEDVGKDTTPCSLRYKKILVKGAIECKLDQKYIEKLQAMPSYIPTEETLAKRKTIPDPRSLPQMTVDELKQHDGKHGKPIYVCTNGYIIQGDHQYHTAFRGRDITRRNIFHFRGENIDKNDGMGRPPYPIMKELPEDEQEYVRCWLDHLMTCGPIVAALKDFWDGQQGYTPGITSWPAHYEFGSHDFQAARDFFTGVLGFKEVSTSEMMLEFDGYGSSLVAVYGGPDFKAQSVMIKVGHMEAHLPHFGIMLNVNEFHKLAERIEDAGIEFIMKPSLQNKGHPKEQYIMNIRDPTGNNFQFKALTTRTNIFA